MRKRPSYCLVLSSSATRGERARPLFHILWPTLRRFDYLVVFSIPLQSTVHISKSFFPLWLFVLVVGGHKTTETHSQFCSIIYIDCILSHTNKWIFKTHWHFNQSHSTCKPKTLLPQSYNYQSMTFITFLFCFVLFWFGLETEFLCLTALTVLEL